MKNKRQTLERLIAQQSVIVSTAKDNFDNILCDIESKIELSEYLTTQMETLSRLYVSLLNCKD